MTSSTYLPFTHSERLHSDSLTPGQMYEPCLSLGIEEADANVDQNLDAVIEPLQIREEEKGSTNEARDPFNGHLPFELTSHIFALYTDGFNSSFDLRLGRPSTESGGPLLLGAVSKLWREVAFGTPRLWNTLNIHIHSSNDDLTPKIELTKQWLDRSGQLPLYLSLRVNHTQSSFLETVPNSIRPLFNLIRNLAPRWHTLGLAFASNWYAALLDDLTCAPCLHTLKFGDDESGSSDGRFHLTQTPSLKHLETFDHFISDISIDWGQITNFEANCLSADEFFDVLRRAGGLSTLQLRGMCDDLSRHSIPATPLTHSALRRFRLVPSDLGEGQLETLFDLLVLPSLENFRYEGSISSNFPLDNVISLFTRSQCQLTHFGLSGAVSEVTADDLIPFFSSLPTITHVKLEDTEDRSALDDGIMTDELLQKLTPIDGIRAGLLPCLQSLKYRGMQTFSWDCLTDFISAGLTEENNNGFIDPTTDKINAGRNSPVVQHQNRSRNPIRFVRFIVRRPESFMNLNILLRARDAGVSVDETSHNGSQYIRYITSSPF